MSKIRRIDKGLATVGSKVSGVESKVSGVEQELKSVKLQNLILKDAIKMFQRIFRKCGWFLMFVSSLILCSDIIMRFLVGTTIFSFQYNDSFGVGQLIALLITSGLGLIFILLGYIGRVE